MPNSTIAINCPGHAAMHTPCKRRRRQDGTADVDEMLMSPPPMTMTSEVSPSPRGLSAQVLTDKAMAECLAMLDVQDIGRSTMVCSTWCRISRGRALWELAEPRLGLTGRIVQRIEVSKRRSRGVLTRGILVGARQETVALRSINLTNANAGYDDGLLPSILREVALLRSIADANHPCVVRFFGIQIHGDRVHIVTKYVGSSFAQWFEKPRPSPPKLRCQIRDRFWQLFRALSFLHGKGILHRNLTPSNVLLEPETGIVKISDYAHGRSLDHPLRRYSPEAPKLRQQSSREQRRLWYRAPELILRQPEYGTAIDIWSAGCLLGEAVCGHVLFASDSEIDHLFRIFRMVGTPSPTLWPEGLKCPRFSVNFPLYAPVNLQDAARAARGSLQAYDSLSELQKNRKDVYEAALLCGCILQSDGCHLMSNLLSLDPKRRMTPEGALLCSFLRRQTAEWINPSSASSAPTALRRRLRPRKRPLAETRSENPEIEASQERWIQPGSDVWVTCASSQETTQSSVARSQDSVTPGTRIAHRFLRMRLTGTPPLSWPGRSMLKVRDWHLSPAGAEDAEFPPLWAETARLDAKFRCSVYSSAALSEGDLRWRELRAFLVDHMMGVSTKVHPVISDLALHLAVTLLDALHSHQAGSDQRGIMGLDAKLAATVCLKLADSYDEHSFEYYQRVKTEEYIQATGSQWSQYELISAEKRIAERLDFRIRLPTAIWFLRACCEIGGLLEQGTNSEQLLLARFILDLGLFDLDLQAHPAPLLAQAALLLAAHVVNARPGASSQPSGWLLVRRQTCRSNQRDAASLCLAQMTHALMSLRGEWRTRGMRAVEERHQQAARLQIPKDGFPVSLVEQLIPECAESR